MAQEHTLQSGCRSLTAAYQCFWYEFPFKLPDLMTLGPACHFYTVLGRSSGAVKLIAHADPMVQHLSCKVLLCADTAFQLLVSSC